MKPIVPKFYAVVRYDHSAEGKFFVKGGKVNVFETDKAYMVHPSTPYDVRADLGFGVLIKKSSNILFDTLFEAIEALRGRQSQAIVRAKGIMDREQEILGKIEEFWRDLVFNT